MFMGAEEKEEKGGRTEDEEAVGKEAHQTGELQHKPKDIDGPTRVGDPAQIWGSGR